jgi:hypothetical protein
MFKRNKMKDTIVCYKRLFDSDDGQKVLKDLMRSCHMTSTTFDSDPQQQAFNEGARSVVLRIMNTINLSEHKLSEFMKQMEEQDEYGI